MRPRIRSVKPEMRQDERYSRLSYPARELFNGLITVADDEGRFRAPASAILGHVFPYDADAPRKLRDWIGEIRDSGMIVFYVADNVPYGAFRHWKRHQKINRPRPSDLPPPPDPGVVTENSVEDQGSLTEHSVKDHGENTDRARSHAQARVPDPDPFQIPSLCKRLADHLRANDPKSDPKPESERWLTDMRLLVADRSGDIAEVERVIDWCQADSFWRSNILSPGKLRKQFTQLTLRSAAPLRVVRGRDTSSAPMNAKTRERVEQLQAGLRAKADEDFQASKEQR